MQVVYKHIFFCFSLVMAERVEAGRAVAAEMLKDYDSMSYSELFASIGSRRIAYWITTMCVLFVIYWVGVGYCYYQPLAHQDDIASITWMRKTSFFVALVFWNIVDNPRESYRQVAASYQSLFAFLTSVFCDQAFREFLGFLSMAHFQPAEHTENWIADGLNRELLLAFFKHYISFTFAAITFAPHELVTCVAQRNWFLAGGLVAVSLSAVAIPYSDIRSMALGPDLMLIWRPGAQHVGTVVLGTAVSTTRFAALSLEAVVSEQTGNQDWKAEPYELLCKIPISPEAFPTEQDREKEAFRRVREFLTKSLGRDYEEMQLVRYFALRSVNFMSDEDLAFLRSLSRNDTVPNEKVSLNSTYRNSTKAEL